MPGQINILLVEDDPLIQAAIKDILANSEYLVESAAQGKDALKLLLHKKYDVIMDEMDGIEFVREVKKRGLHIPIIGMSGHPIGHSFLPSMRLFGVKTTLLKPFSKDELITAITYALSM